MSASLTSFYRSLARHPLFALLNVGGLALGIAAFLLLMLYVRGAWMVDRRLPGSDKVWVIRGRYTSPGAPHDWNNSTMGGELEELHGDYPDLVGTRLDTPGAIVRRGNKATYTAFWAADPTFFDLFPYPAIAGDPAHTMRQPDGLVVTAESARKYFGTTDVVGRTLPLTFGDRTYPYRIGAVLADFPQGSWTLGDMFGRLDIGRLGPDNWHHWGSTHLTTVLRFPDQAAADAFARDRLPAFLDRHAFSGGDLKRGAYEQSLLPAADVQLSAPGERTAVATLGIVGLLTLLIAAVNYVNLATARAGLRAREVAIRKTLGATGRALAVQFLGEAVATVALAALIGLAITECALPFLNAAGGTSLAIRYLGPETIVPPLLVLIVVVGVAAGLYPAAILARFRAAAVLASARAPGGGRAGVRVRQGLVVIQFAVAIAFAIGTSVMLAQAAHLRHADLGFEPDGVLIVDSLFDGALTGDQRRALLAAFARLPGATGASAGQNAPSGQYTTNSEDYRPASGRGSLMSIVTLPTSPGYFDVYRARLIAGRPFDATHGLDDRAGNPAGGKPPQGQSVILNATAARALGFASPLAAVGATVVRENGRTERVIGVVADIRFHSARQPVTPIAYSYNSRTSYTAPMAAIRYAGVGDAAFTSAAEAAWRRIAPGVPFHAFTADHALDEAYYREDARRARLFALGAVLAGIIGCIGLYGLAAFDTARRIKEIGIRKALGASTRDVLALLLRRFLVPVGIANLIAWPLALVGLRRWLSTFDDRIAPSPWFFVGASAAALAIAVATVIAQSWRVARERPAHALRHE